MKGNFKDEHYVIKAIRKPSKILDQIRNIRSDLKILIISGQIRLEKNIYQPMFTVYAL